MIFQLPQHITRPTLTCQLNSCNTFSISVAQANANNTRVNFHTLVENVLASSQVKHAIEKSKSEIANVCVNNIIYCGTLKRCKVLVRITAHYEISRPLNPVC
jgi:hypothetical protein